MNMNNIHMRFAVDKAFIKNQELIEADFIPLRIQCPDKNCSTVYTVFVEDFNQELSTLLGEAVCPNCKRFIRESDDPETFLIDLKAIKATLGDKFGVKE